MLVSVVGLLIARVIFPGEVGSSLGGYGIAVICGLSGWLAVYSGTTLTPSKNWHSALILLVAVAVLMIGEFIVFKLNWGTDGDALGGWWLFFGAALGAASYAPRPHVPES